MKYNQFLLSQLLRDTIDEYNELPYDILWDISYDIHDEYIHSKYFIMQISLCESIEEFIKDNEESLIKRILKFIN